MATQNYRNFSFETAQRMKLSSLYCSCCLEPKTSAFHVLFSEEDDEKVATLLHSHG